MFRFAQHALLAGLVVAGLCVYTPGAEANGANSRNSKCDHLKRKAAFAKSDADRVKFRKLHQQCLRNG